MTDLDAIRARHVQGYDSSATSEDDCRECGQPWPCDTAIAAIRARHVPLPRKVNQQLEHCAECGQAWPCDTAIVLAALDERVTFDEELQRRMDAVRPLVAQRDAAIEREARLRAALNLTYPEWLASYDHREAALATEGESTVVVEE